jgi:sedoheptulokinase
MQNYLGLDIGTTSISLIVIDITNGKTIFTETKQHKSRIPNDENDSYLLDSEKLLGIARSLVDSTVEQFPDIDGIGVTGQMHGVLIIDKDGDAVSPIYTWLDMRSLRPGPSGTPYVSELEKITGVAIPPGYGGATLYYLTKVDSIPRGSVTFCTATDYVAMHLAERKRPVLDPSLAHSLGYFDIERSSFRSDLWREMTSLSLPEVVESAKIIGKYRKKIPVVTAIGDNQASFLGSVREPECGILLNVGTSGQICYLEPSGQQNPDTGLETRPYPTGEKFLVGASLTGGKSFDVLANLIEDVATLLNTTVNPYKVLDKFVAPPAEPDMLRTVTTFKGTRKDPSRTGSISGISLNNLTTERLYWSIARGIIDELYHMVDPTHKILLNKELYIVVSGNAIKRNRALGIEISRHFHAPLMVPDQDESAALGAALIAAAGVYNDLSAIPELAKRVVTYSPFDLE